MQGFAFKGFEVFLGWGKGVASQFRNCVQNSACCVLIAQVPRFLGQQPCFFVSLRFLSSKAFQGWVKGATWQFRNRMQIQGWKKRQKQTPRDHACLLVHLQLFQVIGNRRGQGFQLPHDLKEPNPQQMQSLNVVMVEKPIPS